jgi:hypothetical protein
MNLIINLIFSFLSLSPFSFSFTAVINPAPDTSSDSPMKSEPSPAKQEEKDVDSQEIGSNSSSGRGTQATSGTFSGFIPLVGKNIKIIYFYTPFL